MPRPAVSRQLATMLMMCGLALPYMSGRPVVAAAAQRDGPTGGGGSVVLQPAPAPASTRATRRLVFTCITPDLVVFADRPCGSEPVVRELRVEPAATGPGRAPTLVAEAPRESTRESAAREPDAESSRAATCERLQAAVQALDTRMRNGYSAREASRLWERWREARERVREADC